MFLSRPHPIYRLLNPFYALGTLINPDTTSPTGRPMAAYCIKRWNGRLSTVALSLHSHIMLVYCHDYESTRACIQCAKVLYPP
jgi:hypothetical protein